MILKKLKLSLTLSKEKNRMNVKRRRIMDTIYDLPNWSLVLDKITPSLKRSRRKAAIYFKKNRGAAAQLTISEVAEAAGVSVSTIERLSKDLGFKQYRDFRLSLSLEEKGQQQQQNRAITQNDTVETVRQKIFESNIEAIQCTASLLDANELKRGVELLKQTSHIELYGMGGSGVIVNDACHKFLRMGVKCYAVTDPDLQAKYANLLIKGDVVIAISYSGRTKALLDNVYTAKRLGAHIIAITGYGKSPLNRMADVVLCSCSNESGFVGDLVSIRIAQLTVLDTLFLSFAVTDYERYERIKKLTQGATDRLKR